MGSQGGEQIEDALYTRQGFRTVMATCSKRKPLSFMYGPTVKGVNLKQFTCLKLRTIIQN